MPCLEPAELSQKLGSGAVLGDRPGFSYALELSEMLWGHLGMYEVGEVHGEPCHRDLQTQQLGMPLVTDHSRAVQRDILVSQGCLPQTRGPKTTEIYFLTVL